MTAKKKTTKKATPLAELARVHGVSRETLRAWRDSGLDVQDPAKVAERVATMHLGGQDETLLEAKRRRAIADANRAEILAEREAGSVISLEEVRQSFMIVGLEVKSRLLAMRGDLVHELEGLPPSGIYKILDKRFHDLLQSLYESGEKYKS